MFQAQPPAVVQPSEGDEQPLIEVVGQRPDQAEKIDRRIYRVRENAQSAVADGYQLMRGLPAVTIGPDDQLMLLGNANVTILVDEHPIQGDQAQYLRTIHGGDIDRIEIITNPSAQFPSAGTGGIINIVLKKKRRDGLTGSANGDVSSLGRLLGGVSLKYKKGKWTLDTTVEGNSGRWSRSTYRRLRSATTEPGGAPTIDVEEGGGSLVSRYGSTFAHLTYDADARTQVTGGAFVGGYAQHSGNDARFLGITPDFPSFSDRERNRVSGGYHGVEASFSHKGKRDGETLKGYALAYRTSTDSDADVAVDSGGGYASRDGRSGNRVYAQLDWAHPIGKKQILSLGGEFYHVADVKTHGFDAEGLALGPDTIDRFDPVTDYAAAYATFQQNLGRWTLMPGLRLERMRRDLSSPGRAPLRTTRTDLFPSLHIDHPLTTRLNLSLSYSRRIDRASVDALRPYAIVTGLQAVSLGNPGLRDQATDSYEANLHYRRKSLDLGLIVYDRETERVWGSLYSVDDLGRSLLATVNTGTKSDRGAELDLSTPLVRRVKLMASVNLFDSRLPVDLGDGRSHDESFRTSGNATLQYDGPQNGRRPGDIAQVQLTYDSPRQAFQTRYDGQLALSLTYTRSLTPTLAVTAALENIGQSPERSRLEAPLVQEDFSRHLSQPLFRLKLVKTFGGGPAPERPAGPSIAPGGG